VLGGSIELGFGPAEEGVRFDPPSLEAYFTVMTSGSFSVKQLFGGATQLMALYQNCLVW
jgi:hypothetical protein